MSPHKDILLILDDVEILPGMTVFRFDGRDNEWSSAGTELLDRITLYIQKNYELKTK